jgi:hypothetical protein
MAEPPRPEPAVVASKRRPPAGAFLCNGQLGGNNHACDDRYGPAIVGSVVGDKAVPVTVRLVPNP